MRSIFVRTLVVALSAAVPTSVLLAQEIREEHREIRREFRADDRDRDEPDSDGRTVIRESTEVRRLLGAPMVVEPLPADTLVRVRLLDTLSSRTLHEGDHFDYEVARDARTGDFVWIPAGTRGVGTVTRARRAGAFGRGGKLNFAFGPIRSTTGETVVLGVSARSQEENERQHLATGASIAGLAALGPVGLVGGLFVKGREITISSGSELYVATESVLNYRAPSGKERIERLR